MPTYHYRCKSCKHEFEELQKISESPLVKCPSCHKDTLVRLVSGGVGLVFKGSGFYLTDYKKPSRSEKSHTKSQPLPAPKKDTPKSDSSKTST